MDGSREDTLRLPPQSIPAECAVLGGLLLAPDALWRVRDILSEEAFYRRDHRLIYRAIVELADKGKPADIVTLGNWFDANMLGDQIGRGYLIELAGSTPSAANIVAHAHIVAEQYRLRLIIEAGTEAVRSGFDPVLPAELDGLTAASTRSWFSRWQAKRQRRRQERHDREEREEREVLDRLLAKVSEQGLPALTPAERTQLQRISKRQKERQEAEVH